MSIVENRMVANAEVSSSGEISGETELVQKLSAAATPSRRTAAAMVEQAVQRLKNGDQAALETGFNLYAAQLYRVVQRILSVSKDSQENIQHEPWTGHLQAKNFKGPAKFSP